MTGSRAMAVTPTPRLTPADHPAARALSRWSARPPVGVAFSGGADSTALLWGLQQCQPAVQIVALHVHHGLQAAADDFAQHCQAVCRQWHIPLHIVEVQARHAPGDSPEEAARIARYTTLAATALGLGLGEVLLGQHADDQVETVLLALSRGAGLAGIAGMPRHFERHGMAFGRPLLDVGGAQLRAWLQATATPHIEDPSNSNTAFTRNRIRHAVLPAIAQAFPQYRETFSRTARHAATAQRMLQALAQEDLTHTGDPPLIGALHTLTRDRQANLLRHWLRSAHQERASTAQMDELLDQVAACLTRGHQIRIRVGLSMAVRDGPRLRLEHPV